MILCRIRGAHARHGDSVSLDSGDDVSDALDEPDCLFAQPGVSEANSG